MECAKKVRTHCLEEERKKVWDPTVKLGQVVKEKAEKGAKHRQMWREKKRRRRK